jgi:predicted GNAT family acetyltransferase
MLMIRDNAAMSRFEMTSGDTLAFVEYERADDLIVLTHTVVPEALSGQGVGSKLLAGVLDHIRANRALVVPRCQFVARFIQQHPGYHSLVTGE